MNTKLLPGALVAVLLMATLATVRPAAAASAFGSLPPPPPTATAGGNLSSQALRNTTYSGIYEQPIALTEGLYHGASVGGGAAHPEVEFVEGAQRHGDLDGDGVADAIVFLEEHSGGSGVFTYVSAQLNRGGRPLDAGAVRIGDRAQIKSLAVANGQIALDIVTQGPGDPACCGTHRTGRTYALRGGELAEMPAATAGLTMVSNADLDGTRWTLTESNYGLPMPAVSDLRLAFDGSRLAATAHCSAYTARFNLGKINPFIVRVSDASAKQTNCGNANDTDAQTYLAALNRVTHWGYSYGQLALYYPDRRGDQGRLLFAERPEAPQ